MPTLKDCLPSLNESLERLLQRHSINAGAAIKAFGGGEKLEEARKKFTVALGDAMRSNTQVDLDGKKVTFADVFNDRQGKVTTAYNKLKSVAKELENGTLVAEDSIEEFNEAKAAYTKASSSMTKLLSGKESAFKEIESVQNGLKSAFNGLQGKITKAVGLLDNMLGMVRVNGLKWDGVRNTAEHNLKKMKFWEEGIAKGPAFARIGGVTAGSGLVLDAFLRGKNGEGEDRSWVVRVGEGAAGLGIGAGSLLAGKAL